MYRTPKTSPSKSIRKYPQESPSSPSSNKKEKMQDAGEIFLKRELVPRRTLEIKRRYETKTKNEMKSESLIDLLKNVMLLFESTAQTVYSQMRRDIKTQIENIADGGITMMLEISRRIAEEGITKKEDNKEGMEEQLKAIKEMIESNINEWRDKKEKEEEKRQEVEETIINIKEEIANINKKVETSEDNIVAEVIDLERKIKTTNRTGIIPREDRKEEEGKMKNEINEQKAEEIIETMEELKEITVKGMKEILEEQQHMYKNIETMIGNQDEICNETREHKEIIIKKIKETNDTIRNEIIKDTTMLVNGHAIDIMRGIDETKAKIGTIEEKLNWEVQKEEITNKVSTIIEEKMNKSTVKLENDQEMVQINTYASATRKYIPQTTHSIIIESEDINDTADEVIQKAKNILDPKAEGIKIDKIRKVRDQKIILGCKKEKDIEEIKRKLEKGKGIKIEKIENKNPLAIIKEVPYKITEEELVQSIINQNKELINNEEEKIIKIKFRKKAIDEQRCHVVIQIRPTLWKAMTGRGYLYVEMERLKVEDQSPLIQCTRCLGFGHGMKFCQESARRCSHCGDPHLRANCPEREAGRAPQCCNCAHAGLENREHNAFSKECGVRDKWEYLARTTTAYE
ncbi:unnamed protein product [Diatraea saccharalis]|uniref:Uncharacterized protein n=1 Tax=Diatraea saccharalis TaxID=40085 RepID=A0A9N9R6I6_9NEOP|nr:unnamed protein product [Diatraea saccharalis]